LKQQSRPEFRAAFAWCRQEIFPVILTSSHKFYAAILTVDTCHTNVIHLAMVIFDSSTLILLARCGLLECFISRSKRQMLIPYAVRNETLQPGKEETPFIEKLIEKQIIITKQVGDEAAIQKLMKDFAIDLGETEAILLAHHSGNAIVATDDRNAIRACRMLGLGYITALSIVISLCELGALSKTDAILKIGQLQRIGRYSRRIIEEATATLKGI
jgi:predicted nucleic acid-binding protein